MSKQPEEGNWNVAAQAPVGEPDPFDHYFIGKWFDPAAPADPTPTMGDIRYLHSRIDELYKYAAEVQYLQNELRIVRQDLTQVRQPWWKRWFQ